MASSLVLHFAGWFQCRLATNPDPTDELRGVSGYTFALAGEPDLDRVIRLQDPVAPRSHGPEVGVTVVSVSVDGQPVQGHPLRGARVELLGVPKFESRNLLLTEDRAGVGLIDPFHIQISGSGIVLRREDLLHPENPGLKLHQVPPASLRRRAPVMLDGMIRDPIRIADATGIVDPVAYRRARRVRLEADLRETDDPVSRAALEKRIQELDVTAPDDMRTVALSVFQARQFDLNGLAEVVDQDGRLRGEIGTSEDWPIAFWMGAWDADALCGYMRGMLTLPFRSA